MKKLISIIVSVVLGVAALSTVSCSASADYNVGILEPMNHVALDAAREGFCSELNTLMSAEKKTVKYNYQNANGDSSTMTTIVSTFISKNVDMMLTIGTGASQTAAGQTKDIPILFTAVTDPVNAKLVESIEKPNCNVSGTSDMNPVDKQIQLIKELGVTKVALLYTSSEDNSKIQIQLAETACKKESINLGYQEYTISSVSDLESVMSQISQGDCNGIYIPTDNTIANATASVHQFNMQGKKLPVVCGEEGMNSVCGIATYAINYTELGKQTAEMAYRLLVGKEDIKKMSVEYQSGTPELSVNQTVANELGITIPQSVLDKVAK